MRVGGRTPWKPTPRARRIAIVLTGLLLTFAVVAGLAHAGGRYFYCEAMQMMQSDPCVVSHEGNGASSESTLCAFRTDCCEMWTLPSMPLGTTAENHFVPPAGLLAVLPASQLLLLHFETTLRTPSRMSERWQRPPRTPGELRAQLMVFLT